MKWLNGIDAHNALHNFKQDVIKIDTSSYQNIETSSYQNIETSSYQNISIILSNNFDNLIKIDIRSYHKITQLYASIQLFI